ncbi:MAG: EpsI family protein [Deltaproteobacteria bacterium]|jgi:EpsI family protein|nr:EpsI family protein [Deltaproteobacteria bacterium]
MNSSNLVTAILVLVLLAVGGFAWSLQVQPALEIDASALSTLPMEIDVYEGEDVPVESTVESVLRADFNLQRSYYAAGSLVWLYVGYYGTTRGGRPEHTPRGCYTGAGWGIESARTLRVIPDGDLRVNEYVVEREGERRLVHFWFRSVRKTGMLGGWDQNIDRLIGRLTSGRADGALIRISTPLVGDDEVSARGRLLGFASVLDPLIAERWPTESEAG